MKKVIIWGHKNTQHTHKYIHSSYYKAFKYLELNGSGMETYWFDDNDDVSNFDFNNSIFFTEDQSQRNIPLNRSCKYILHHTNLDKYNDNNLNYINLANYLKYCDEGVSAYHKENTVEKINDCCFLDNKTKTIYQPWATDLTPNEIILDDALNYNPNKNEIYYIGLSHDNSNQINLFRNSVSINNKNFQLIRTNSDEDNRKLIRESLISVDIRGEWHIECGYLPCRIFKNISYGRLTGTNSENIKNIFGDYVVYEKDINNLYNSLIEAEKTTPIEKIKEGMLFIKEKHTFINRINNLLKVL
jgi:hypothetical protein